MLPLLLVSAALAACPADPLAVSATPDRAEDALGAGVSAVVVGRW